MLGHSPFYNSSIKNYTSVFGTLFNDLAITRVKGAKSQTVKVPLQYASKDKAWSRRTEDPTANLDVSAVFPRMAFMLTGMNIDHIRKTNPTQYIAQAASLTATSSFPPIPYNFEYELYIASANIEDGLQIVEQILPFFNPEFTVTTKDIPALGLNMDVPVVLNSVNYTDNTADTDFSENRIIEWTLSFTVKGYLYGPISTDKKIIKTTKVFIFEEMPLTPTEDYDELVRVKVNPSSADPDDPHTIKTEFFLNSPRNQEPIV